jgi:hypothetical protein
MTTSRLYGAGFIATTVAAISMFVNTPTLAQQPTCLHGADESPEQQARRRQALQTAREINNAEQRAFQTSHSFVPLSALRISSVPDGFTANLAADTVGYAFAIKDQQDACKFAYYSDEVGVIYAAEPIR